MSFQKDRKLRCDVCKKRIYVKDGKYVYHIIEDNGPCPNSGTPAHLG